MTDLSGQRVLITAGAAGIGRAMAEAFLAAGARVWVGDIDAEALTALPSAIQRMQLDAADEASVAALFTEIAEEWGGLDTLCANAGIAGPTARVEDIRLVDWRACLSVNLEGAFLAAKYAVPMMRTARGGRSSSPPRPPACTAFRTGRPMRRQNGA